MSTLGLTFCIFAATVGFARDSRSPTSTPLSRSRLLTSGKIHVAWRHFFCTVEPETMGWLLVPKMRVHYIHRY